MLSPTIERRLTAIEQRPQSRPFDSTEPRDPREMTSLDIAQRIAELNALARWRRQTYCPALPPGEPSAAFVFARIAELRARAVVLAGTPLPRRALPVTADPEADDA
jgi:hypothetical protein